MTASARHMKYEMINIEFRGSSSRENYTRYDLRLPLTEAYSLYRALEDALEAAGYPETD